MKELFVPYELAKQLKEKRFNEAAFGYFNSLGELVTVKSVTNAGNLGTLAPMFQQVQDWFRENHDIDISVNCEAYQRTFFYWISKLGSKEDIQTQQSSDAEYKCHYEALSRAIEEALKLI